MAEHKFSLGGFLVSWIARLLYFSALTVLIPFGALMLSAGLGGIPQAVRAIPTTALLLVGVSAVILLLYHRNIAATLASLGWMTLLPGLGGLVFLILGKETIIAVLQKLFLGFGLVESMVGMIEQSLPNLIIFVIGYIILGLLFLHIAGKIEHKHAITAQIKKLFGPRARVLRSR